MQGLCLGFRGLGFRGALHARYTGSFLNIFLEMLKRESF